MINLGKLLAFVFAIILVAYITSSKGYKINPVLATLSDLEFTDQNAKTRNLSEFKGKMFLMNFFFTSCQGVCPNIMGKINRLHFVLKDKLTIISITVDPKTDSIEKLKEYEKTLKADQVAGEWVFGRLDKSRLNKFMEQTAKLASSEDPQKHAVRVLLVDQNMDVRSYRNGLDSDLYESLMEDVENIN